MQKRFRIMQNRRVSNCIILKKKVKKMNVIIAAAGTGGHINPGIAIANKIKHTNA